MKTKPTVTIGIPAFNEEANIYYLLKDLLAQNTKGFKLSRIIINSDGSVDKTVSEVRRIKNKKIVLLNNRKRNGRSFRQNQIMQMVFEDALVLVDADTLVKDKNFLRKITAPIFLGEADLTSARVEELQAENFMERVLETSMKLKKYIFENINNGNNLFTCHGRSRAFSRKLYKSIKFKDSVAEDAYSYLYCISRDMKYKFIGNTEIFYKLPSSFEDHQRQSIRFIRSKDFLTKKFGRQLVEESYKIPTKPLLISFFKFILKKPFLVFSYVLLFSYMKLSSIFKKTGDTWDISVSSKKLRKGVI